MGLVSFKSKFKPYFFEKDYRLCYVESVSIMLMSSL